MATVRTPSSLQAQITRSAISPRLAMRIFLNMRFIATYEFWATNFEAQVHSFRNAKRRGRARLFERCSISLLWPDHKQFLPVLNRLPIASQLLDNLPSHVGLNFVEQLHRFYDAENLAHFDRVPDLRKGRSARRWSLVESAHNRRLYRV